MRYLKVNFLIVYPLKQARPMSNLFTVQSSDGIKLDCRYLNARSQTNHNNNLESTKLHPIIIFVHQLGKLGGSASMMAGMATKLTEKGYDCIIFNLRGVGSSSGYATWNCYAEVADVKAVIDHAANTLNRDVFLVGSSAGAPIAGSVLDYNPHIKGCVLIGYVWGFFASFLYSWAYKPLQLSSKPKLFVIGSKDEFTSLDQYKSRINTLQGEVNISQIIDGKNHFEIEQSVYDEVIADWVDEFITAHVVL